MDFDFTDEQQAIKSTARELLGNRAEHDELWRELCELGWPGIAVGEEHGGQGLGVVELALLVEQLGYACASTPILGTTLAALAIEHAGSAAQRARWLPGLAAGEKTGALALRSAAALVPDATPDGLVVLADDGDGTATAHTASAIESVEAIDPRRRHGTVAAAPDDGEALEGDVRAALDRALVVVAAELLGLCRRALDLTVAYVKERRQFGVAVGSFQAVQHAAAQMLRDTEATAAATYYAAWAADAEPASLQVAAATAKALASDAGRAVTASAIQLHGGIGFTWEAELHWLFKRAQIDAAYLGGASDHRARVCRLVADARPRLVPA
jgi:alkylation response protein AidB-like acyl-CoA dehydrogenase